jgi:hypothetical protein
METHDDGRRSDRIALQLPIRVAGTDAMGASFVHETRTLVISRHGARILLPRKLVPDQEVNVHCLATGQECDARVVGQIGEELDGYYYGVSFLNPDANPWGIEFPALDPSGQAVGRIVLQCLACQTHEVAHLDEFEIEVLEANSALTRYCMRCTQSTLWRKSEAPSAAHPVSAPAPATEPESLEKRREPRRELRVRACIHSVEFSEEIVWTRNISRGGLCFETPRRYAQGWKIEVAVPYSPGGGNIFLPARIARIQRIQASGLTLCGVSYIRNPRPSPPSRA